MRRIRIPLLPLLLPLLPLVFSPSSARAQGEDPAHDQLRAVRREIIAAIESRDPDEILAHLHPEVVVTWQDSAVCHGKDELRAFYERRGKDAFVGFKVPHEPDGLSVIYGGDTAISAGRIVADYRLLGKSFEFESRWTATLVLQDGKWLVAAYHVSLDALDNPILDTAKTAVWVAGGAGLVAGMLLASVLGRLRRRSGAK